MNHDSSQSDSISCVRGGSVGITENFVACEYSRATVPTSEQVIAPLTTHESLGK